MRDDDEQDEVLRSKTETTLREGKVRGILGLGGDTQADTQVRGGHRAPGFSFDTYVEEAAETEVTGAGELTQRGAQTRVEVRRRQGSREAARPTTDEAARGFPLPPPVGEEADDEHTEVQAGPTGMGFVPEEHDLGPGFASVSQARLPLAKGARQNPLPGIAPMPDPVPTPALLFPSAAKAAPVVKSVPTLASTDWPELTSQPVSFEKHLTPQRVALTQGLTSLTDFIRLSRSQRWIALAVLLFAAGGLLVLLLSTGGEKKGKAPELLADRDLAASAEPDPDPEPVSDPDPEPEPEPVSDPEPEPELDAPKRYPARARKLHNRGRQLFKRGKHAAALRAYQQALALDPTAAEIQRDLGQLHQRQGEWSQAREAYRKYLELAPKARDARQIRARLYRLRKR